MKDCSLEVKQDGMSFWPDCQGNQVGAAQEVDGAKYKAIVEANKEVIKDENKIFPGQKIRIPKNL